MLKFAINKLINNQDLTEEEMIQAMNIIMDGNATDSQIGSFLTALHMKGETVEEITGGARVMRNKAAKVEIENDYAIDTCGTGGDRGNSFNVSTVVAIIAAATGIKVVKHGNRSVSSKCGSADVLETLGINIELDPIKVKKCTDEINIGFMFAPKFHKAMKNVIGPRRELGIRTVFNVLGPLTNPAMVKKQVLGVFDENYTELMAGVLKNLGAKRAMVVHGLDGLDEITITTKTKVSELKNNKISTYYIDPRDYGFELGLAEDLTGGYPKENAEIILNILKGEKSPRRDMVLLNAAAAIYIGGKASSFSDGIEKAKEAIDKGLALEKLSQFIKLSQELAV
ncbi:anthranilate phosphoribosyltransferase [Paramaledivibacter caminithermalis]|jgi:anthranilate phosphoribosyltransferase|uniref:Anthranilate phosphoribosyltransferase n=1 Tax=Paramaledivibacter caminithermalis (strain DSM 15212 / CIP 107654 / DViRD3) TaxID=1121301 RepID=A0A1M6RIZ8_PARC5|nr:anthranilate phosphoribosyltransferase [Paramaledivibacter caminithermalis]SHK32400.1 anthranilate phosphoribosyltransferase [Paramaledivibacter caminithermalis DSM 15212]